MASSKVEMDEIWSVMKNDVYLSQFTEGIQESDIQTSLPISSTLTTSEQQAKLTRGIGMLEKGLHNLVTQNYKSLVSQGTWIYKLESTLENIQKQINHLLCTADQLRSKILEPYEEVKKECLVLDRLHETTNLLRCIIQVKQLSMNLCDKDMVEASNLIKEVDDFCNDVDLSGIDAIEKDLEKIKIERNSLWTQARSNLNEALNSENMEQARTSIKVFMNLRIVENEMKILKESAIAAITKEAKQALDIQSLTNQATDHDKIIKKNFGPGRVTGSTFPGVNVGAFRSKLWSNWSHLLETIIYQRCVYMYILQVIVSNNSQISVKLDSYEDQLKDMDIVNDFWSDTVEILSNQLISSSEASTFIKQALEIEYPKLLRIHAELTKKLQKLIYKYPINNSKRSNNRFFHNDNFASLFENAYLSRSVSRLLDVVHSMFSNEGLPMTEDIDKFMKMLSDELKLALIDEILFKTVVKNIGKAIRVFCLNSEQLVKNDGNSSQVIDIPNTTQQLNANVANTVLYMRKEVEKLLAKMPRKLNEFCKDEIGKELVHSDELINNIMLPLVNSISDSIESIILTIHKENYKIDCEELPSCSQYMKELQRFITRAHSDYLKPFQHKVLLQKHCLNLAKRTLELFLRHVCLLRPVNMNGKEKIKEDFKKIEIVISPFCSEPSHLGESFKKIRAFSPLISVSDPEEIANNEVVGKIVPHSLILMYLYSIAPAEMPSPHESCNWSVARLSQWLDKHASEHERLELVSGALQRYQQDVKRQNKTTYHELYPVMATLLDNGFFSLNQSIN